MNILRTRLILVSLALVIPLSLQAYSFKNLTNSLASAWNLSSRSCKDLAKTINAKKKQ